MRYPNTFAVSTSGDRALEISRSFGAPRALVFDAFTKPELVRQWLLGPPGWTMPVCEIDLSIGGAYRYVWRKAGVRDMGIGGSFREIVRPTKLVATEKFDDAWYPGEAVNTTVFAEKGALTEVTITVLYESKEAREIASRSGMETGMAAGFDRLEDLMLAAEAPSVVDVPGRLAAAIHVTIPRRDIQTVMGRRSVRMADGVSAAAADLTRQRCRVGRRGFTSRLARAEPRGRPACDNVRACQRPSARLHSRRSSRLRTMSGQRFEIRPRCPYPRKSWIV